MSVDEASPSAAMADMFPSDWVIEADRDHSITSWSVQGNLHPRHIVSAEGSWFTDADGKRYLDFQSQLVNLNLGHQHPRIIESIKRQADRMCYIGPTMANDARSELASMMAEITPGDLTASFFTTGGGEANEAAVRLARAYTGRQKVITRYRSYHGATAGAMSLTGDPRRWATEPGMSGVVRMLDPYTYRCPAGHPDPCPVCSGGPHLEELLMYENPGTVAAVMLETVTGTNGLIVPPDGYLQSIREVCDRYGILLILDEVMAGFGRTGKMFACENFDVVPDIMCVAKGINSGYVPLGAMVVSSPINNWLQTNPFTTGLTYAGHPLACASGVESIKVYSDENIVEGAARSGQRLGAALHEMANRHPSIGDVRGLGMFWGVELVKDRGTREPLVPFNAKGQGGGPMTAIMVEGMRRGLYLSFFSNVIRIAPPLNIIDEDLDHGLEILDQLLDIADQYVEST
jgi:taurine---2-oxoglutarate transaminase